MQKITGDFPLNLEPADSAQLVQNIITPSYLHYVRNHGEVPSIDPSSWSLDICGIVRTPRTLTLEQIKEDFSSETVTVTISCDGNRRKEMNAQRPTMGSNFGPCAVSTAIWTGVSLVDIIRLVEPDENVVKFVWFEGSDKLDHGCNYETSITYTHASSPANRVILAFRMNGEELPLDHGFPLRIVIPGFVGGRQVKWLRKITFSKDDTLNWYHLHDNRLFPSSVVSRNQMSQYFDRPETILYSLNVNSAIIIPKHEAKESLTNLEKLVEFKGYAHAGIHKVSAVHLSLDEGETWKESILEFAPDCQYSWAIWSLQISLLELSRAKSVQVKAFDESYNSQPNRVHWNILGTMNNSIYQVRIKNRGSEIVFLHPVLSGPLSGGYLDTSKQVNLKRLPETSRNLKTYSWNEVRKHNHEKDCWIVISDLIYDVTMFLEDHPGGSTPIRRVAGTDATNQFNAIHSQIAHIMKQKYLIGRIKQLSNI